MATIADLQTRLRKLIGDNDAIYMSYYLDSINDAARETYPKLYRRIENTELITGNILPPFIWTSSTTLAFYTTPLGDIAKTTTGAYTRYTPTSCKFTAGGAMDYMVLSSDNYKSLLDVQGKTVTSKIWAYPEVANNAILTLYTLKADTTTQTLSATTSTPVAAWTKIELEDQALSDDLVTVEVRSVVYTSGKYAYFDPPRLMGLPVYDYMLPQDFQNGNVNQVWIQTTGYSDDICDDLHPNFGEQVFGWKDNVIIDGYKHLHMPYLSSGKRLLLKGICPLESDSTLTTNTITIADRYIPTLLTYAAFSLYEKLTGIPSSDSRQMYQTEADRWYRKYQLISRDIRMPRLSSQIGWTID
jgi:hypothetical protein